MSLVPLAYLFRSKSGDQTSRNKSSLLVGATPTLQADKTNVEGNAVNVLRIDMKDAWLVLEVRPLLFTCYYTPL